MLLFRYDSSKGMESLEEVLVSQANARQRRGRAGRVTSGVCFHLFTSYRFEYRMAGHQIPGMLCNSFSFISCVLKITLTNRSLISLWRS